MKQRQLTKVAYKTHSMRMNMNKIPTCYHTIDDTQPTESYLTAVGIVERDGEKLEFHDIRLYFKAKQ